MRNTDKILLALTKAKDSYDSVLSDIEQEISNKVQFEFSIFYQPV